MSESSTPRKRSIPEDEDLPSFDDPADKVNAVISQLQAPEEKTNVALTFANDKNLATEVQAYAKIAGTDWTFYVKSLAVSIGRNTDVPIGSQQVSSAALIDIDLGPAKVVSRQHANINYNLDLRCWELKVLGRNGARIDGQKVPVGSAHSTPLHSGAILDIGGTQMMFILPDSPPTLPKKLLNMYLAKYKANMNKRKSVILTGGGAGGINSHYPQQHSLPVHHNQPQIKSFQMFDKAQLSQSPTTSATSLQNNLDQDLSKEEAKDIKPPYSYATMITQAILSNDDGVMSLSEIYNWISSHYAYYKYSKTGWQNSIRHNLSLNKAFEKVPRRPNEPGKGMKWQISESYKEDFLNKILSGSLLKQRRGSSVSRQLQLHLATHQQLPEPQKYYLKESNNFHQRTDSLPKLGQPIQYGQAPPMNPVQPNALAFLNNNQQQQQQQQQQHLQQQFLQQQQLLHHQQQQQQQQLQGRAFPPSYGFQAPAPPHMMYGNPMAQRQPGGMGQPGAGPGPVAPPLQQHTQHQHQQSAPGGQPQQLKAELSSPMRQSSDMNSTTPKLPKVVGHNLFNLPPPSTGQSSTTGSSAPQAHHSRSNSYNQPGEKGEPFAPIPASEQQGGNSTTTGGSSGSTTGASGQPGTGSTDLSLGFTSPKKVAPLEAFTPERGSKSGSGTNSKLGVPSGPHTNQSSPAFWNFVQFSTPNGQTPLRKNSDELNGLGSPTLNRKPQNDKVGELQHSKFLDEKPDYSPLKGKTGSEKIQSEDSKLKEGSQHSEVNA